jgi:predicted PurR-regulated permease PerM
VRTNSLDSNYVAQRRESTIRFLLLVCLSGFLAALILVLLPFVTPLLWAVILTTTTWPLFIKLRNLVPSPPYAASLLACFILTVILLVILIPIPLQLAAELRDLANSLKQFDPTHLRNSIYSTPLLGSSLGRALDPLLYDPSFVGSFLDKNQKGLLSLATSAARSILVIAGQVFATLIASYLLYRNGDRVMAQCHMIVGQISGEGGLRLIETVHMTVIGAAYGMMATAVAQGTLAGLGYYITGAPLPLLLSVVTMIAALIPFGAPVIYLSVAAYLILFSSYPWYHGAGLALWGILVISTVDNIIRPIFISHSTKLPPIFVFVGVIGGVMSFGALGVFIGPALIAGADWLWSQLARPTPTPTPE